MAQTLSAGEVRNKYASRRDAAAEAILQLVAPLSDAELLSESTQELIANADKLVQKGVATMKGAAVTVKQLRELLRGRADKPAVSMLQSVSRFPDHMEVIVDHAQLYPDGEPVLAAPPADAPAVPAADPTKPPKRKAAAE